MPTITTSIGTDGRDYSTIAAWEADLDNGAIYSSGDTAVGECYNDSTFSGAVTIDGGGAVGLSFVSLTANTFHRHNGIAGSGVRTTSNITSLSSVRQFSWIELSGADAVLDSSGIAGNLLVTNGGQCYIGPAARSKIFICVVIGDFTRSGFWDRAASSNRSPRWYQCTAINCTNGFGSHYGASAGRIMINCMLINSSVVDCQVSSLPGSNNLTSDSSAPGTSSLINKIAANQVVSVVLGSEDPHLKEGADAIDAGTDLGATYAVDIDGFDRDADPSYDPWDIGAHEFQSAGGRRLVNGTIHNPLLGRLAG